MLKIKVTKEEFGALPDVIQAEYKADGDNYTVQVDGMKTQADVDNVLEAKRKEKEDRVAADARVKTLESEVGTLGDKIKVYESDESKKLSAEERVDMERLKRELETKTSEYGELETKYTGMEGEITMNTIKTELRKAAVGVISEDAINDSIDILADKFVISDKKVLTNSDLGDKSGLEAKAYLSDYVKERSYLQPKSSGAGADGRQGSGGGSQKDNPTGEITASQEVWGEK